MVLVLKLLENLCKLVQELRFYGNQQVLRKIRKSPKDHFCVTSAIVSVAYRDLAGAGGCQILNEPDVSVVRVKVEVLHRQSVDIDVQETVPNDVLWEKWREEKVQELEVVTFDL